VTALCRYTLCRNIPPCFVALVPQEEELDDQKIQVTPAGFQLVFSCYADNKGKVPFTKKVMATPEQVDKVKAIQHSRNLEALALDLMEPEQAADLTLPEVEAMNKKLGSPLVDKFKELLYPPDYNHEGKVSNIKHNNEGFRNKRPKVEYSEEKLKNHISNGTLGKFTVPMLKGLKKQEPLEALTNHFQN
ncbi:hypothetical protein H8957_016198, partial [Semnopithecus entellus]